MNRREMLSSRVRTLNLIVRRWAHQQICDKILVRGEKVFAAILVKDAGEIEVTIRTPRMRGQRFYPVTDTLTSDDWTQIVSVSGKKEHRVHLEYCRSMGNEPLAVHPATYTAINAMFGYRKRPYRLKWVAGRLKGGVLAGAQPAKLWRVTAVDSPRGFP